MATTFKIAVDKMGATDPYNYIGRKGDIFYDPEFGELRISDGDTPYGAGLQQGIGGSTPTINQVLQVDNTASLEAKFAGGIRFESVESLEGLQPITIDADVQLTSSRTLSANNTNFGTLNGLTIPAGSGTIALLSNIAGSGTVLEAVEDDTAPRLGGDLDTRGFSLTNAGTGEGVIIQQSANNNKAVAVKDHTGNTVFSTTNDVVTIKENAWPTTDGETGQDLITDGAGQLNWAYRNPYSRFYYYYGGAAPGIAVTGSDVVGVGIGSWTAITAGSSGVGNIANYAPVNATYNPKLTGVSFSTNQFTNIPAGSYDITLELHTYNSTAAAELKTCVMTGNNNQTAKTTMIYPGQGATNYNDPLIINIRGIFTFEESNIANNTLQISVPVEQNFSFYVIEAILTIIKIS